MPAATVIAGREADSLLDSMGLSREIFSDVSVQGLGHYLTATPFHSPNAAGTFQYHEMVHSLRQHLIPRGWRFDDSSLALVFNEESNTAIAVRSGDSNTGQRNKNPWFKHSESPTMQRVFGENALQLGLFNGIADFTEFAEPVSSRQGIDFSRFQTWWFLHHVDTASRILHAELSLPVSDVTDATTRQWKTRIILDSIPFDEEPQAQPSETDTRASEFDVVVRKRAL